ncbi:unnamed protein product [Parajaminaea phylloscopi]
MSVNPERSSDTATVVLPGAENTRGDGSEVVIIWVTAPSEEDGTRLTHGLLQRDLVACCNALPGVKSTYRWQGEVCTATEVLLVFKTLRSRVAEVTRFICSEHPYEEPEVVALDIIGGSEGYLDWVRGCVLRGTSASFAGGRTREE